MGVRVEEREREREDHRWGDPNPGGGRYHHQCLSSHSRELVASLAKPDVC